MTLRPFALASALPSSARVVSLAATRIIDSTAPRRARCRVVGGVVFGLISGIVLATPGTSAAAPDPDALVQQMTSLNKAAIVAYSAGDFDKSKSQLLQAVALAKKDGQLQTHPIMARTFLHLGVLYIDGFEDHDEGLAYFVKALKLRPDIEVTSSLATQTVKSAFEEAKTAEKTEKTAKGQASGGGAVAAAHPAPPPAGSVPPAAQPQAAAVTPAAKTATGAVAATPPATTTPEKGEKADSDEKAAAKPMTAAEKKKAAAEEKKRLAEKERQDHKDNAKLLKDLALAQGNEGKERAAKEKLQTEKAEKEKALAETKSSLEQLQKDVKEKEKQAQAEKEKAAKELALLKESEAKERAAKEKLQTEKAEKEKELAEAKASIQQLQKTQAEKDKQLTETAAREKKEREAKEKLDSEKQAAEAREKERKDNQEKERVNREKLAAGPEVPTHLPKPIYCDIPDEAQAGTDLFVHCVAQQNLKDKEIAIFYRPSGGNHYNSLALEASKKGWRTAMIPADRISGKVLQYYVEVRDGHGAVAAADGKPSSPNILTLKPAGALASRSTTTKLR